MIKKKFNRREFAGTAVAAMAAMAAPIAARGKTSKRPNIIFILADDLGYADLGCYGAPTIRTPALDLLAKQGVRLTQGYSNSAVCSATRTALVTGRYQYRVPCGLHEPLIGNNIGLPVDEPTLPKELGRLGYRNILLGKWHIGGGPNFGPLRAGYHRFFGIHEGGINYFDHKLRVGGNEVGGLIEGETPVDRNGYLTDLLGDRAIDEIRDAHKETEPFFLSLHFTAPHWPWEGPEDEALAGDIKTSVHLDGGSLKTYAKMVEHMDQKIGNLMAELDRLDIADDTIVVFTSDNGGERFSNMWPFTGMKTELLEGGIRVPLIVRWGDQIPANSVSDQVMTSMDFAPTLLAAAGQQYNDSIAYDGLNLLDVLAGRRSIIERKLYWRFKAVEQAALRAGNWKYLKIAGREYLFNLILDQHERANLAFRHPERFAELKADWENWNSGMLPYTKDTPSHGVIDYLNLPDRYGPG